MGLKNSQYQAIMRSYEQKQLRSHDLLNSHYEEVCRVLPEFRTLDESISDLSIRRGKQLLNGDDHAVDSLHEELSTLRERKKALLKSAGFPDDYLEPQYECSLCKEYRLQLNNKKCRLLQKSSLRSALQSVQSGRSSSL